MFNKIFLVYFYFTWDFIISNLCNERLGQFLEIYCQKYNLSPNNNLYNTSCCEESCSMADLITFCH